MIARRLAMLSLLVGGCTTEPPSDEGGETEQASSSTGDATATSQGPGTTPQTSGTSGDDGTDTDVADGSTGVDPDTGEGSSSGGEPVGSPGCEVPLTLEDGEHTFMLDGYDRRYILRLPQSYTQDQPWPLIFALHGNGGNPGYWDAIGGDRDIRTAFQDEAVLIIPEAIDNQWRDYSAPPETWPDRIELELAFFDTVLQTAMDELCIDPGSVFSMGFSGGGSFSGVLGCRREYIRAIAVGGSVIYFEPDQCVSTPAAWITIGDQELTTGREEFRDFFRDLAGCSDTSMPGTPDGCIDYDGCNPDTPVIFCSHPAGHVWPSIGTDATKAFFEGFYGAG
ncbi:MAG: hypothetical protein KC501_07560 [Myxococcales bacterium]|nr:hypothetical protein [Myxococcales bacterium]